MKENTPKKYPRTSHLLWSPGATSDDKILKSLDSFMSQRVVVTEKMDGENCSATSEEIYARSLSSNGGILRERVKALWSSIRYKIPTGWRICGENMQWQHSIRYENLISPLYIFSVWDENNHCIPWEETLMFAEDLGIPTVKVLKEGIFNKEFIEELKEFDIGEMEGYVVRVDKEFHYDDFSKNVAKYVRANHVQTDNHWTTNLIENGFLK